MTSYDELMALAKQYCDHTQYSKDLVYTILKRALTWIVLPVSYEKAIQELCRQMQY